MGNSIIAQRSENGKPIEKIHKTIIQDPEEFLSYLQDESHLGYGRAEAVYFPESEGEVCALLSYFQKKGTPVTVSGARTGVVGGAVPRGGVILSMERMNHILGIYKSEQGKTWYVQVEAGIRLKSVHTSIESKNVGDMENVSKKDDFVSDPITYFYPPDPTEDSALIGGTAAANSSGARSFAYGPTRNYIHRLKVVLANGELLDILRGKIFADESNTFELVTCAGKRIKIPVPSYRMPEVKNAAGYYAKPGMDLIDLFIGSEGTLGIITLLELKIIPTPENIFSGIAFFPKSKNAYQFAQQVQKERSNQMSRIKPTVLEYFDSHSLDLLRQKRKDDASGSLIGDFPDYARSAIFFEQFCREKDLEDIYESWQKLLEENEVSMDDTWGGFEKRELIKMKIFRHTLPEILNEIFRQRKRQYPQIQKISLDISLPEKAFHEMLLFYKTRIEKQGLEYVLFGHIGEYHLHLNILPRNAEEMEKAKGLSLEFAQKAVSLGGTISAEHGIGKIKHEFLEILYGSQGVKEMVRIKLLLDPKGILSRGNIFSESYLPGISSYE